MAEIKTYLEFTDEELTRIGVRVGDWIELRQIDEKSFKIEKREMSTIEIEEDTYKKMEFLIKELEEEGLNWEEAKATALERLLTPILKDEEVDTSIYLLQIKEV